MKKTSQACDHQAISLFLENKLAQVDCDRFVAHLEECPQCQTELAGNSAEPEFWHEAVDLLKNLGDSMPKLLDSKSHSEIKNKNLSVNAVLSLLSPTDDPQMLGRIGEYEISGVVGLGGMGAVLKGFDKSLMRVVAIKVMAPHLAANGSARVRFEREARAAAAITHNNVVDIYRVAESHGLPYLVMPFARGPSLQKRIDEGGPLSTTEVVQIGRQIASGLTAAHEQGLVHRDIKPANILLNDGIERVLITDFGVARAIDDASMTQTGLIAGTPQYMSPEQARGEAVDCRSDLFSLGSVLYTACTGRPPFRAESPFGVLKKITDSEPRPIRTINPDIPEWLANIILKLLAKEPSDRFHTPKQVADLLEKCLAHLHQPTQIQLPDSLENLVQVKVKPSKTPPKRRLRAWILAASFALVASLLFALFQLTNAPDISGLWEGESWDAIELSSVEEAADWYSGEFRGAGENRGAIHLEWSRLHQRYEGRWSNTRGTSGTIVIRQREPERLSGAMLFDSDSETLPNEPRLREFVWKLRSSSLGPDKPTLAGNSNQNATATPNAKIRSRSSLRSPVKGVIRWANSNLQPGSKLTKGDLVVEIKPDDDNIRRLREHHTEAESKLETLTAKANAYAMNVTGFTEARDYSIAAATELVAASKSKYISKKQLFGDYQDKVWQKLQSLPRSPEIPKLEREKAQKEWDVANADLASMEQEVETFKREWKSRQLELEEKRTVAQTRIDHAKSMQQQVLQEAAQMTVTLGKLERMMAETNSVHVNAPLDCIVIHATRLDSGQTIQQGDELLRIAPNNAPNNAPGNELSNELRIAPNNEASKADRPSQPDSVPTGSDVSAISQTLSLITNLEKRIHKLSNDQKNIERQIRSERTKSARINSEINSELKHLSEQLGSIPKADGTRRTNIQNTIANHQNNFQLNERALERAIKVLLDQKAVNAVPLKANLKEKDTMIKILESEVSSKQSQLQKAQTILDFKTAQVEQGDLSMIELESEKIKLTQLNAALEQVEYVLMYARQIGSEESESKTER